VCCCCFCCCSKWVKKATRVTLCVKAAELEKEKWIVCAVANRSIMYALCCAELGLGISMLLLIWSLMMI